MRGDTTIPEAPLSSTKSQIFVPILIWTYTVPSVSNLTGSGTVVSYAKQIEHLFGFLRRALQPGWRDGGSKG